MMAGPGEGNSVRLWNGNRIDRVKVREIAPGRVLRPEVHAVEAVGGYILPSTVAVRIAGSATAAQYRAGARGGLDPYPVVERRSRRGRRDIIAVYLDAGR